MNRSRNKDSLKAAPPARAAGGALGNVFRVSFFVFSLGFLIGVVFFVSRSLVAAGTDRNLQVLLDRIDALIQDENYPDADAVILDVVGARERSFSRSAWRRILKRAIVVARADGRWEGAVVASGAARAAFPNVQEFAALALFCGLRASVSPAEQAAAVVPAVSVDDLTEPQYATLKAEALLSGIGGVADSTIGPAALARLGPQSSAADFRAAWELTGDPRYRVNAALLAAGQGDLVGAYREMAEVSATATPNRYAMVAALLAYDIGRFGDAVAALAAIPAELAIHSDVLSLQGDIAVGSGDFQQAGRYYAAAIRANSETAVEVYTSLIAIGRRLGSVEADLLSVLRQAVTTYPHARQVTRDRFRMSMDAVDWEPTGRAVADVLDSQLLIDGSSFPLESLAFFADQTDVRRHIVRLWDFVNADPNDSERVGLLLSTLMRHRDLDAIEFALNSGLPIPAAWRTLAAGLAQVIAGDAGAAYRTLANVEPDGANATPVWKSYVTANRAAIAHYLGYPRQALEDAQTAWAEFRSRYPDSVDETHPMSSVFGRLLLVIARAELALRNPAAAEAAAVHALRYLPGNSDIADLLAATVESDG